MTNAAAFPAELWGIDELAEHLGTSKDFFAAAVSQAVLQVLGQRGE